ncbi:hypothetical protein Har1130_17805 [Haloarcula sp. CBA1130]|uniref:hypothetical protein n=1 Tax=unclassified Haloarcula TaxID=2624677 RepID=UPI001246A10B|nr:MULTISPECIES: hypothetical protein [unclassified Haloarcula]KAA9396514.1 hypothetical protein Har1130_17805 [Haloarcula sp. CBA1130]KAA9397629.1 hypothetical protein Har1129_05000 [Haloarcula sp. CBA1129]
MQEDTHEVNDIDLPRFVRRIGIINTTERGRDSAPTMGVLPAFGGVLELGMSRTGGLPPGLTYLTLPDLLAPSLLADDSRAESSHTDEMMLRQSSSGSTEQPTDRHGGPEPARASGSMSRASTQPDSNSSPPRVSEVLRETSDDGSGASFDDVSRTVKWADGPDSRASTTDDDSDKSGLRGSSGSEADLRERPEGADAGPGPVRELRRLEDSPGVLEGAPGSGGDQSRLTGPVSTVLATGSLPGRGAGVDSPTSGPDMTRSGDGAATSRTDVGDSSGSFARPSLEWRESDTPSESGEHAPGPDLSPLDSSPTGAHQEARSSQVERPTGPDLSSPVTTPVGETGDGFGTGTGPPMTVLDESPGADTTAETRAGERSGRGRQTTPGSDALGDGVRRSRDSRGDELARTTRETAHGDGPGEADWPFPRNLSLEGGGPDARFLEEIHRELTKKMRIERDRRGF